MAKYQVMQANAQADALEMIEDSLKTEQGKLAAQFLMGQRYIKALSGQAKSSNTLLVN